MLIHGVLVEEGSNCVHSLPPGFLEAWGSAYGIRVLDTQGH